MATLRLGSTLNAESIKEGDDVYFECSIQANPDVTRLVWKYEVSIILKPDPIQTHTQTHTHTHIQNNLVLL